MIYVDYGAFVFGSRHQLEIGIPLLLRHFAKFGLEMHTGKKKTFKKRVCFLPHIRVLYLAHLLKI